MKKKLTVVALTGATLALVLPALAGDSVPASLDEAAVLAVPAQARTADAKAVLLDQAQAGSVSTDIPRLWFVQLKSAPAADGTAHSRLVAERGAFRAAARQAGIVYGERAEFEDLFNGFSVAVTLKELRRLQALPEVSAVFPVLEVKLDEDTDLYTALGMTGANIAQSQLGFTGYGIKVAVMDTGIDYDHPDLGGCFGPGCRVRRGRDFVGDAFNADPSSPSFNPIPDPDADPDDCNGHGTHVSGIIGANGVVRGVAPEVEFGAYRVFGCEGSTTSDVMIQAMEKIKKDRPNVLNMSIGSAFQWPEYPTAVAADKLVRAGIVVVTSNGNEGAYGLWAAGAPGQGDNVIAVGSIENTHAVLPYFEAYGVSPSTDAAQIGYGAATGAPAPPISGTMPLARTGTTSTTDDACTGPLADLTGKAVLIRRGTCGFTVKAHNAEDAGAIAVIIYNNAPGRVNATVASDPPGIPVVTVSDAEGALIDGLIAAGDAAIDWTDQTASFAQTSSIANHISSFSSYGPTPELQIKPQVSAPGGNIFSTYPLEKGGYTVLSGTSMASPHTAGAAALILEATRKKARPAAVLARLQSTADPIEWYGAPGAGYIEPVHRQGAGQIDIDDAILTRFVVSPSELALGEFDPLGSAKTVKVKVKNRGPEETFDLSFDEGISTYGTRSPGFYLGCVDASFSTSPITIPRGGRVSFDATFTDLGCDGNVLWNGYVTLTAELKPGDPGPAKVLRVPFLGYSGDYQAIAALTPTSYDFPWLATFDGSTYYQVVGSETFGMTGSTDRPYFLVHFEHQVRQLQVLLTKVGAVKTKPVLIEDYLPRNSSTTGFFAFEWDGRLPNNKPQPNGTYDTQLCGLKALGDKTVPTDWECFDLPQIVIDRP